MSAAKEVLDEIGIRARTPRGDTRHPLTQLSIGICSIKINPKLHRAVSELALRQFLGKNQRYRYAGTIKGANNNAPTLLVFSKIGRVNVHAIPKTKIKTGIGFVAVSNSPNQPPVTVVSSSAPYHMGMGRSIHKSLESLNKHGPFKVLSISGHAMAPVLVIRDGKGQKFGYSHSASKIFSARQVTNPRTLPVKKWTVGDWKQTIPNRLNWFLMLAKLQQVNR